MHTALYLKKPKLIDEELSMPYVPIEFEEKLKEVTADSGYCSEKNLLFLKNNNITSYIKLQDHEKRKTRAYKEDIGKYYNMSSQIFEDEHYYVCHDGRELSTLSFLYPKINMNLRNKDTPTKMPMPKGLHFCGVLLFPYNWVRNQY